MLRPGAWAVLGASLLVGTLGCVSAVSSIEPGARFEREPDEAGLWQAAERLERDLEEGGGLSSDVALATYLDGVAARLIGTDLAGTGLTLRVRAVRDPYRSAFATANGALYVSTGLLASLENEAQLASVLGHEIAHFTERHLLRQKRIDASSEQVAKAGRTLLTAAGAGIGMLALPLVILGDLVVGTGLEAATTGYSRDLEREADRIGFQRLAGAGYDAPEGARVFTHLREELVAEGAEEPFFLGSHPRLAEREASYAELLQAHGGAEGDVGQDRYAEAIQSVLLENLRLDLALARRAPAHAALERHLSHDPSSAEGWYWRGELTRRERGGAALEEAVRHYLRALELAPTHKEALLALGLLYREQGRDGAARPYFTRYLAADPGGVDRELVASYLEPEGHARSR